MKKEDLTLQVINDLIPRADVMKMLGYKSIKGFMDFEKKTKNFPKAIRLSLNFNEKKRYSKAAILDWLKNAYKESLNG